jgi:hypothetical protein
MFEELKADLPKNRRDGRRQSDRQMRRSGSRSSDAHRFVGRGDRPGFPTARSVKLSGPFSGWPARRRWNGSPATRTTRSYQVRGRELELLGDVASNSQDLIQLHAGVFVKDAHLNVASASIASSCVSSSVSTKRSAEERPPIPGRGRNPRSGHIRRDRLS